MPLSQFLTDFKEISKEKSFRNDVDFSHFQNDFLVDNFYSFRELFSFAKENKVNLEDIDEDFFYSEITNVTKNGEVNPVKLNLTIRKEEDNDYYKKIDKGDIIKVKQGEILLSKVRPNLKKYVSVDSETQNYYFTSAFIHLIPTKLNKILYYALRTVFFENLIAISRQGKGYPTLKEDDFYSLKFDKKIIDKLSKKESELTGSINEIEGKIKKLKITVVDPQRIIDDVFIKEFGFNENKFTELKSIKVFNLGLSDFSDNIDLRNSVKFHRKAGAFVIEELKKITNKKIKHFLDGQIVLGSSVSPSDYDINGDHFYLSMANIKNWKFEEEDAKRVSLEYSNINQQKTVKKDDIIVARSGEGTIGKVAIIDDENLKAVFADFTMRIRLKNYNSLFAYFYFRTTFFQYLIEINKKGLGNNTNIFPNQIQELPLLNIPLSRQKEIVKEIKTELDKQEETLRKIDIERQKIDELIQKAVE